MNELTTQQVQLPDNLEDLTQFVLIGKTKLQAYMLKLQTVNRLSVAQEIRDQTLKETQEVSNALIAAEQRIGELLLAIPKASGNYAESENRPVSKNTIVKDMGYSKDEASDFQQMAKHPEVVQKVIEDAIANGEIVTKSQVMKEIKALKDENSRLKADNITLSNRAKPEVIEKEVIKEVVPPDYEMFKREAAEAKTYRKLHDEAAEKLKASESQLEALKKKMNDPDEQHIKDLHLDAMALCGGTSNFLEKFGGWTYFMSELDRLTEADKKAVISAVTAIARWADEMLNTTVSEVVE